MSRDLPEVDRTLEQLLTATAATSFDDGFVDRVDGRIRSESESGAADTGRTAQRHDRGPLRIVAPVLRLIRRRPVAWVAAAAVVTMLVFGADQFRWRTIVVDTGTQSTLALSDGSVITLAPGSNLRYRPFRFRSIRHVRLDGEAFFEVAPDSRSFVVRTFNANVLVTGTRFNVRAWQDDRVPSTEVALVEGAVDVYERRDESAKTDPSIDAGLARQEPDPVGTTPISLRAGQSARIADLVRGPVPDAPDPATVASWRSGGFAYRERPLADIFRDLERRFGVRITLDPNVPVDRRASYLNPGEPALPDVLDAICFALGLRYSRTADGYRMVSAG